MFKKIFISLIVVFVLVLNFMIVPTFAEVDTSGYDSTTVMSILKNTNVNELKAKSSLLMEASTGKILLENNIHEKRPLASVTKIMS